MLRLSATLQCSLFLGGSGRLLRQTAVLSSHRSPHPRCCRSAHSTPADSTAVQTRRATREWKSHDGVEQSFAEKSESTHTPTEPLSATAREILASTGEAAHAPHLATSAMATAAAAASIPTPPSAPAWTLAGIDMLLRRHEVLASPTASPAARRVALRRLTEEDRLAIRGLVDHLTQRVSERALLPSQQQHWVPATCRLAARVGFYNRCCELFFLSVDPAGVTATTAATAVSLSQRQRPSQGSDVVPLYLVDAAVASRDAAVLGRCAALAEEMHAAATGAMATSPTEEQWTASPGVMSGLRVYCGCVELFINERQSGNERTAEERNDRIKYEGVDSACAVAYRLSSLLHLGLTAQAMDDFFRSSVRLARYASSGHADAEGATQAARAAVCLQVFRHWCRQSTLSSASWLTATCLHMLISTATWALRWDSASLYMLSVDVYFHHRRIVQGTDDDGSATGSALDASDDALVIAVLRYHLFSRQPRAALRWLAELRRCFPRYLPSVAVGSTVARLAADIGSDSGLALWCLELLLDSRQPVPPKPAELFACVCALAGSVPNFTAVLQSLLDNGLLTLSEEELLYARLLHCRGHLQWRAMLDALLAEGLSASAPALRVATEASIGAADVAAPPTLTADPRRVIALFTPRNIHAVLLVMQEGEHPLLIVYYRFFVHRLGAVVSVVERARWAVLAAVWATTHAGRLLPEDAVFIARELQQLIHSDAEGKRSSGLPASLRRSLETRWALLYGQYSECWWNRHLAGRHRSRGNGSGSGTGQHSELSPRVVVVAPALATQMPFAAARFLRKKSHMRLSAAPSELYAATTRAATITAAVNTSSVEADRDSVEWVVSREVWSTTFKRYL